MRFIDRSFSHRQSLFMLVAAAFLNSLAGLVVKFVRLDAMSILGIRSVVALALMLVFTGKPKFAWSKAQIGGAVAYALTLILFVQAVKLTTAANAALLLNAAPIYVAVLGAWLLKERTTRGDWLVIGAVMCGMVFFFLDKLSTEGMLGNILAMLSGMALACTGIAMRYQKDGSPLETFVLGHATIVVLSIPALLNCHQLDFEDTAALVLMGLFQSALGDILYAVSIKSATALESKLIYNIRPILTALWVFVFLGEKPGVYAILGGTIVLGVITAWGIRSVRSSRSDVIETVETEPV